MARDCSLSEAVFDAQLAAGLADDALFTFLQSRVPQFGYHFEEWHFDHYDHSVEFDSASPEWELSEELRQALWDSGFDRCWVNHTDNTETYWLLPGGPSSKQPKR